MEQVSLIPVRGGNGEMERLAAAGEWQAPALGQLEEALEAAMRSRAWWSPPIPGTSSDSPMRVLPGPSARPLGEINLSGCDPAAFGLRACGWS